MIIKSGRYLKSTKNMAKNRNVKKIFLQFQEFIVTIDKKKVPVAGTKVIQGRFLQKINQISVNKVDKQ